MTTTWFRRLLQKVGLGGTRARRRAPPRAGFQTRLEVLEDRTLLSTWEGGSIFSNNWTDQFNWYGFVAPAPGDSLTFDPIFPAIPQNRANFNDFPTNTKFNIVFFDSGYTLTGNGITLGSGGVDAFVIETGTSHTNTIALPINFPTSGSSQRFDINSEAIVRLVGTLSGPGGLTKNGVGILEMAAAANTFTGPTTINEGTVRLSGGGSHILGDVVVHRLGTFDLNNTNETIGALIVDGGTVNTGTGLLTLSGNLTGSDAGSSGQPATINGRLGLGTASRTFTVSSITPAGAVDTVINAVISGNSGLVKNGNGVLALNGINTSTGPTTVNAGTLAVNGTLPSQVIVNGGAILAGTGTVAGIILPQTVSGIVQVRDDGDASFSTTGVWTTGFPGQGFQNDVSFASAGTGSETATWTFTVTPGNYRVSATWSTDPNRATNAPFTIRDGGTTGTVRARAEVNQERAPVGIADQGVIFQDLSGSVLVNSGTLTVQLSNNANEFVIADAIRIERVLGGTVAPGSGTLQSLGNVVFSPGSTYRVNIRDSFFSNDQIDVFGSVNLSGTALSVNVISNVGQRSGTALRIVNNDGSDAIIGRFAGLPNNNDPVLVVTSTGAIARFHINYAGGTGNDVDLIYDNTFTMVANLAVTPATINEGDTVTLTGNLVDPDEKDHLTLRVDWGDGHVQTFHNEGTEPFAHSHRYLNNPASGSQYRVHVTWFDEHGDGNSRDLFVTVNNVPPTVHTESDATVGPSGLFVRPGSFSDPGPKDIWIATVDYGDGSGVQPLSLNPAGRFLLMHRYAEPGTYRVTVTVADADGGVGAGSFLVTVANESKPAKHEGRGAFFAEFGDGLEGFDIGNILRSLDRELHGLGRP